MAITVAEMIARARKAVEEISDYNQEQIDKLVYDGAKIIFEHAEELAELAVEETRLGNVKDKIGKNTFTPAAFWDHLKDKKSVGIIAEYPEQGMIEVAHPVGVVGGITPATNPTVTPLGNFMHAVKCKNAIIISCAPRAQKTSTKTVDLIRETLVANGAPADLVQILEEVSIENSAELMKNCDLVLATGSSGLTKAAYSSGTPAYGVGAGNPPVIIDRDYDITDAAVKTIEAVGSDNGILCDGDNLLLYPAEIEAELFEALRAEKAQIFENADEVAKFRESLFHDGKVDSGLVGKDAPVLAQAAGYDVPEDTSIIGLKINEIGKAEVMTKEIMGPIVVMKAYDKFEDAVDMAVNNMVESGGVGHTAGIFSNNDEHVNYFAERVPVARVLVNQPTPDAWGPSTNALTPAVSEGCGTWGNNILSGNVDYIHMMNISKIVRPLPNKAIVPAEIFAGDFESQK